MKTSLLKLLLRQECNLKSAEIQLLYKVTVEMKKRVDRQVSDPLFACLLRIGVWIFESAFSVLQSTAGRVMCSVFAEAFTGGMQEKQN